MSTKSTVLRNTAFLSVGTYVEYFLGMISTVLIARALGPGSYGVYALVIWFVAFAVSMVNGGVTTGLIKFLAEAAHEEGIGPERRGIIARFRKIQVWKLFAATILLAACIKVYGESYFPTLDQRFLWALLIAVWFRAFYKFSVAVAKGLQAFSATALTAIFVSPVNLLIIILVATWATDIRWFLSVYLLISVAFWIAMKTLVNRKVSSRTLVPCDKELAVRIDRHLKIVTFTVILETLAGSQIEIVFLGAYGDVVSVGLLKAGMTLAAGLVLLAPGVFGGVLLPMMAGSIKEGVSVVANRFQLSTKYLLLLSLPLMIMGSIFAGDLIVLLFGQEYSPASTAFIVCLIAIGISSLGAGGSSFLLSAEKQNIILIIVTVASITKIVLGITVIKVYGLPGALISILFVAVMTFTSVYWLACRTLSVPVFQADYLKVCLAVVCASIPALILRDSQEFYVAFPIAVAAFLPVYLVANVYLKTFGKDELRFFIEIVEKAPAAIGFLVLPTLRLGLRHTD